MDDQTADPKDKAQGKGKVNRCPEVIINWQQRHENETDRQADTKLLILELGTFGHILVTGE